jgi:hypothetical protein
MIEYGATSISVNPDVIDSTRRRVAAAEERMVISELDQMKVKINAIEERINDEL